MLGEKVIERVATWSTRAGLVSQIAEVKEVVTPYAEMDKKDMGHEVSCLEIGSVPEGRTRSRFLAVGGWDNTIRILSLDPDDCMAVLAVLALPAQAESAALVSMALGRATGAVCRKLWSSIPRLYNSKKKKLSKLSLAARPHPCTVSMK